MNRFFNAICRKKDDLTAARTAGAMSNQQTTKLPTHQTGLSHAEARRDRGEMRAA